MSSAMRGPVESYPPHPGVVERQAGSLNGTTAVVVVGSAINPAGEGMIRQVTSVTVPNNTSGALSISLFLNDGLGGAATLIDYVAILASGTTYSSAIRIPIILLRDYDYLEMKTTASAVPNYFSVWTEGSGIASIGSQVVG